MHRFHQPARRAASRLAPIALALPLLLAALAAPALAAEAPVGGSLTTRANVSGSISQERSGANVQGDQVVLVGGARSLTLTGTASTNGTLAGAVVQRQTGNATAGTEQLLSVGGVSGTVLSTQTLSVTGTVAAPVLQLRRAPSAANGTVDQQVLAVGSVQDLRAGGLSSNGSLTGNLGVVQDSNSNNAQRVLVATASGAVGQGNLNGVVSAGVGQLNRARQATGSGQLLGVGRIDRNGGGNISTNAQVLGGGVAQDMSGGGIALQQVEVGSVLGTDSNTGTLRTEATLNAAVTQVSRTDSGNGGLAGQILEVATIVGGAPQQATARGTVQGSVTQTQTALANQRISVGRIAGASGSVQTDATVTGALSQSVAGTAGSGVQNQLIAIGEAQLTAGTVSTRAVVLGNISQGISPVGSVTQVVEVGSVRGTGALAVSTDVTLTGNITQQAGSTGSGHQAVLLGSVTR